MDAYQYYLLKALETQNSLQKGVEWDFFHLGDVENFYQ